MYKNYSSKHHDVEEKVEALKREKHPFIKKIKKLENTQVFNYLDLQQMLCYPI